ncbi:unnamed protein product [Paramecium sonneborni]|uniref:Uncharacterized protein n=1 Tax=Paramecium sonneborni TaxID=65129 RepID=A0A8S1P2T1_9CILI|nr:unnamed protein product [Paramecium sonneborni]
MSFCLDIQQSDTIIKESSIREQKQGLFPNQLCTFKAEDYLILNNVMESIFQIIFKELGYQENLRKIIIDKNFAQLYFIQNEDSKRLEIDFHLLAIDLALEQQEVVQINAYFDCVEKISKIQMKEISIASNIFWKKGISDSIELIKFIDNNLNKIQSNGLQYLKIFKEELLREEVIVIHESICQPLMAVPSLRNEQTTCCSICSLQ